MPAESRRGQPSNRTGRERGMAGRGVGGCKPTSSSEPRKRRNRGDTAGAGNRECAADHGRSTGTARGNATRTELHRNRPRAPSGRTEIDHRQRRGRSSPHGRRRLSNFTAALAATEGAEFRRCAAIYSVEASPLSRRGRELLVHAETSEGSRWASTRRFARIPPPISWGARSPSSAWPRRTSGWESWS